MLRFWDQWWSGAESTKAGDADPIATIGWGALFE